MGPLRGWIEAVVQCSAVVVGFAFVLACAGCIVENEEPSSAPDSGIESTADATSMPAASPNAIPIPTPITGGDAACPANMVLVEGAYCPDVKQTCLRWMDAPGPYQFFRCAVYAKPECLSKEPTPMRFCIDRYEYTPPGDELPVVHQSWTTARAVCESLGKRLCLESEWQFACEGPEMHAYPYGDGFHRDVTACNVDRLNLGRPNSGLRDLRTPSGSHPRCVSPFGVFDMSGNVEEWATIDRPSDPKEISSMKGAWWLPGRNHCRAATTGHGQIYEGSQVGVRCCAGAP